LTSALHGRERSALCPGRFTILDKSVQKVTTLQSESRDSSVGIALGYVLDDRGSRVRFPVGAGNFSLHHLVQNGPGAHPDSYAVDTGGSFPGGKAAGREADHSSPSSAEVKNA
jgi:hypothetical protein